MHVTLFVIVRRGLRLLGGIIESRAYKEVCFVLEVTKVICQILATNEKNEVIAINCRKLRFDLQVYQSVTRSAVVELFKAPNKTDELRII